MNLYSLKSVYGDNVIASVFCVMQVLQSKLQKTKSRLDLIISAKLHTKNHYSQ